MKMDKINRVCIDGHELGVVGKDDTVVIFMPGVFELTIDRESAALLAKAIYAKAARMSVEEAAEFCGIPPVFERGH
jgi:hypothetical protein